MTHEQAVIAGEVYRTRIAYVDGVRYTALELDEQGAILIGPDDSEIFVEWQDIRSRSL